MVDQNRFQVRVSVVLASLVMKVAFVERSELLQPAINILNEAVFIIVHVNACRYVHGGD